MKKKNDLIPLLNNFFSDYLPNVKGLSENSIIAYQYAFQLLFTYLSEKKGLQPEDVTFGILSNDMLEGFLAYLEQERSCSIKTRNLRRAAILSFAKYASKRAFASSLTFYATMTEIPKKREPKKIGYKHLTQEEAAILLKTPDSTKNIGQRDITLLSLLYATGARAQELCDITIGDIVIGSPTRVKLTGKGEKSRIVTIPDTCTAILKEYLRIRYIDVNVANAKSRHLFSSQTNEHMTITCVEEIVKKYVDEAKKRNPTLFREEKYTPHSFRHSIAVHRLEAGESLVAIKAFLGHASVSTTAVYAQVTPELASKYLDARGKPLKEAELPIIPQPLALELPFLYRHR